jgi:hypothetical protein
MVDSLQIPLTLMAFQNIQTYAYRLKKLCLRVIQKKIITFVKIEGIVILSGIVRYHGK